MHHLLTIGATDGEVGNMFGHAFAAYSTTKGQGDKIKVEGLWGFYAETTNTRVPVFTELKEWLFGLNIELTGNHGKLINEEMRYYDLGYGLHGATFELNETQAQLLKTYIAKTFSEQQAAVDEAQAALIDKGVTSPSSYQRYRHELGRAHQFQESPRLKPFELNMRLSFFGVSFQDAYTCKSGALNIAKGAGLSEVHLNRLSKNGQDRVFPRNSGPFETLYWHSVGERRKHISKRSGKAYFYRDFSHNELYWTLPPQETVDFSHALQRLCVIPGNLCQKIKDNIKKLQKLEKVLVHAEVAEEKMAEKNALTEYVVYLFQQFSTLEVRSSDNLEMKLLSIKVFFDKLYSTLFNDLDDLSSVEMAIHSLSFADKQKACHTLDFPKLEEKKEAQKGYCCC